MDHPAVAECGVIGRPDDTRGEVIAAFVLLKNEQVASAEMRQALVDVVRHELGPVAVIGERRHGRRGLELLRRFQHHWRRDRFFGAPMVKNPFRYCVVVALVCCSAMIGVAQDAPRRASPRPAGRPVATVQDLMLAMVDPSSDVVFQAVATTISIRGQETKTPQNDHEWAVVRNNALTLLEAGNLLMVPGRRIANAASMAAADALAEESASVAEKASAIELPPDQIEKLVAADRTTWIARAQELVGAATSALRAAEKKDAETLLASGDAIDAACEHCHLKYWYPKKKK